MGLYKRGDTWWMSYTVEGVQYRESTYESNRSFAEGVHRKVMNEVEGGQWSQRQAKSIPLGEMIEKYEKDYSERSKYLVRDKSIFKHLIKFFGKDCELGKIERKIGSYEKYRSSGENPVRPATVLKELGLLRIMFNIAYKQWRWKMTNPVSEIRLPVVKNERVRYLNSEEKKRLLEATGKAPEKWFHPLVITALNTGLRLTNLCELRWSDVDLSAGIIKIAAEQMKNQKYLGIPINDEAYRVLREAAKVRGSSDRVFHDNGKPLLARRVQRAFTKAVKLAKITNFHFHDLRHTFASYLRQMGIDLDTIRELLGHRDPRMTMRYAHLNIDNLKKAVSKVTITNLSQSYVISGADQVVPTGVEPVS